MTYRPPELLEGRHILEQFSSGEPELDQWLQRHALTAQASDTARVYVTTLADEVTVVGYFALASTQVAPDEATERILKGQPHSRPVPGILLARLAVDETHQGVGLGRSLMQDALLRCAEAAKVIGARVLLVHAKHAKAKAFYMQYGFEESPTDPLHLVLLMKDLRRFLERAT